MNWTDFVAWVNDPARTRGEIKAAYTALGLTGLAAAAPTTSYKGEVLGYATTQPDMTASIPPALATAIGVPAPTPPPVPPPPVAPTPTPTPTPAPTSFWRNFVFPVVGGAIIALLIIWGVTSLIDHFDDNGNGDTANASANANATAISQALTAMASTTATPTPAGANGSSVNGTNANGNASGTNGNTAVCPGDQTIADPRPNQGVPTSVDAGCIVKGDVEVGSSQSGPFAPAHTHDGQGNLLQCPDGCWIIAGFGANVSDRSLQSLIDEQSATGCANNAGCVTVHTWCFINGSLTETTNGGTCLGTNTKAPTVGTQPINDGCEPEIPFGEKRIVKSGCIVMGDVLVRPAGSTQDFDPVFDNRTGTGTIQKLDADYEVWNSQGASVYPIDSDFQSVIMANKLGGCGTGHGCPDGMYDWSGNRLDQ